MVTLLVALPSLQAQTPPAPAPAAPAAAPAEGDITAMLKSAMAAFDGGDFPQAITGLNQVLKEIDPKSPQVEAITFSLGAAYFNTKQYPEAIATFKSFVEKFPTSQRRNEAIFATGQAQLLSGDQAGGAATLKTLENVPGMRDQALIFGANAAKAAGNNPEAIATLEKLTSGGIRNSLTAKGAIILADLYIEAGDTDKASALINKLQSNLRFVENIVGLDSLTLRLGDKLFENKDYAGALEAFRRVRLKEEIIEAQQRRIADMEASAERLQQDIKRDPAKAPQNAAALTQIRADIEASKKQLADFQNLPPILGPLYLRMARAFAEQGQPWESIVVYEALLKQIPTGKDREPVLFALVATNGDVNQPAAALQRADDYLKEFPAGPNVGLVKYLRGMIAVQSGDTKNGETWLTELTNDTTLKPELAQQVLLSLANIKFSQGRFPDAIADYRKFIERYPSAGQSGELTEEAVYRIAIANLFDGKFEEAIKNLNEYLAKYPSGAFRGDAKYRLAYCSFAAQDHQAVIDQCLAWEKEFPDDNQLGEVASLLGDAYVAKGQSNEAVEAYKRSYTHAATDQVLNYSIFEAAKLMQQQGRWADIATMFEDFVRSKPDHPTTLAAMFWIGKAKARDGKPDEAKQFLAENIKKFIDDPSREPVEEMLAQLAQLTAKRKRPPLPAPGATPAPAPAQPDPAVELEGLLAFARDTPTAEARALFAKSELARFRRQPEEQQALLKKVADFKPEDLSPPLLGVAGDYLLDAGELDHAAALYKYLLDYYPKSPFIDFAYAGLGEVAYEKGEYDKALTYFNDGTQKIAPNSKLAALTLGRAKAMLALNRDDEAKPIFELVAQTREWRGEPTAESVFSLGEIQRKKGNWAEANAFYQRVFVTYRKFTKWVAKSYLQSAEMFVKLGKNQEAMKTLSEMLRDEKLAQLPEAATARERLKQLSPQS